MPSLNLAFLKLIRDNYANYPVFIETGTLNGETTFALEPYFNKLHTVEFSETYYERTKSRYTGSKINFILGDSSLVLEKLLPTIRDKTIFFLDGHWSGGDTGHSAKDVPLIEEITHINNLFQHQAIIVIDDFRLFGLDKSSGKLGEDWSYINKQSLLDILQKRINNVYHLPSELANNDRLVIHINPITV
jgi:hypothetical protein